jgi:hypothetical protein
MLCIMLSVVMLNVASFFILSEIMLGVVIPNKNMVSVVAPSASPLAKPFQPCLTSAGTARAYPSNLL